MKSIFYFLFMIFIITLLIGNTNSIYKKKTIIDDLEEVLTPIKASLDPNSIVGFRSNNNSSELYGQTQFIVVPVIINNKINDTMLLIDDLTSSQRIDSSLIHNFKILQKHSNNKFSALLLKKEK